MTSCYSPNWKQFNTSVLFSQRYGSTIPSHCSWKYRHVNTASDSTRQLFMTSYKRDVLSVLTCSDIKHFKNENRIKRIHWMSD